MNLLLINLLDGAAAGAAAGGSATGQGQPGGGMTSMLLMLVAMFAIMYFFMIRPQRKRQKELQEFRNKLDIGTKVVTAGGLYGTIKDLNKGENYVTIEVAKGVAIQVDRNYVYADSTQAVQR